MTAPPEPDGPQQFGNAEANLRFLDTTATLTGDAEILEIGTGTGGMLRTLLDRGYRARGVEINPVNGMKTIEYRWVPPPSAP